MEEARNYYNSLNIVIEEMSERNKSKREKDELIYNGTEKGHNAIDKLMAKRDYEQLAREAINLGKIQKEISDTYFVSLGNFYSIPEDIKTSLQVLANNIKEEEFDKLSAALDSDIRAVNYYDKVHQINSRTEEVLKMSDKFKLSDKHVIIYDENGDVIETKRFNTTIQQMMNLKKEQLDHDKGIIELVQNRSQTYGEANNMIDMVNDGFLENKAENSFFITNVSRIVEQKIAKEEAEKAINMCEELRKRLDKENDIEFTKLKAELESIVVNNRKVIQEANKLLSKVDINKYEQLAKDYAKSTEEKEMKNSVTSQYVNLVNTLAKLKHENPDNLDEIQKVQDNLEQLKKNGFDVGLNAEDFEKLFDETAKKYEEDMQIQKEIDKQKALEKQQLDEMNSRYFESVEKKASELAKSKLSSENPTYYEQGLDVYEDRGDFIQIKDDYAAEIVRRDNEADREAKNMLIAERQNELRELAKQSLEESNVSLSGSNANDIINSKMYDMIREAYMTPVERGINDWIKSGYLPENATIDSLTPSQINDLNYSYRNGSQGYENVDQIKKLYEDILSIQGISNQEYVQDLDTQGKVR